MSKATTGTATKTKKPSVTIQTGANKAGLPSSSPSSATKRLPGSAHAQQTPTTNGVQINGMARPGRRPPRATTRLSTSENLVVERKATIPPEPYMITEKDILKKHRGKPPSMIVHMHPSFFRFDSQEGSFSYQSEMRMFIDHLRRKTIPHDLIEDFRRENVRFYDGWLIVKIVDHRSVAADTSSSNGAGDDDKPFSIHNYNHFITPSPYASYPSKEQLVSSPPTKLERSASTDKENVAPEPKQESTNAMPKVRQAADVKEYMVALKPTELSRQTDLMLDFIAVDPKSRKPQAKSGPPSTPIGTVPPTPISEKPPPLKKQKLRIDPKDHLEYEARIINATAPPLYLDPAESLEDADRIHKMLADPLSNEAPPSPKSRKRTVAELAADDAHAKEQERFMLVMDAKGSGANTGNAGASDQQPGNAAFQPRFERFNALDKIKQELREKERRENEKRVQDDEMRRSQQQEAQEQERKRQANQAAIAAKRESALARQQQQAQQQQQQAAQLQMQQRQNQEAMAQQQQANAQLAQRRNTGQAQATAIPPNMQNQMIAQASSPIIRQGTPNIASSPAAAAAANSRPMARNGSQGGAGSPARPGSAMQHAHPNAAGMMRQPSGQGGPSRNGTPQLATGTPAMPNATPILRQGTPAHSMAQASPMASVNMGTPQMAVANMQGQMQNGMHPNAAQQQQMIDMRRNQIMQQAQMNGQQMNPQMAQHMAQQQAQLQRQAAMQQRQQAGLQGTPQPQHMSPNPQQNYQAQVRKAMMQQMGQQGSPGGNQISPQQMQQMQQMQMQQQAMQNQQGQVQQQVPGANRLGPQAQAMFNNLTMQAFKAQMTQEAHRYGGNPGNIPTPVKHQLQKNAQQQAMATIQRRLQLQQQQQQQQQAQQQQNQQPMGQNTMMNPQANQMMNANMGQMGNMNPNMGGNQQQFQQNLQASQLQQMQINNVRQQMQGMNYQQQLMQQQMMNNQAQGPR